MTHDEETTEDDILIVALATGLTYVEAGNLIGRSAKTVQRRMADPEFAKQVSQARAAKLDEIAGQLTETGVTAVSIIKEAMAEEYPMKLRLAAAGMPLRQIRELRSAAELEARLREVEALAKRLAAALDPGTEF